MCGRSLVLAFYLSIGIITVCFCRKPSLETLKVIGTKNNLQNDHGFLVVPIQEDFRTIEMFCEEFLPCIEYPPGMARLSCFLGREKRKKGTMFLTDYREEILETANNCCQKKERKYRI